MIRVFGFLLLCLTPGLFMAALFGFLSWDHRRDHGPECRWACGGFERRRPALPESASGFHRRRTDLAPSHEQK